MISISPLPGQLPYGLEFETIQIADLTPRPSGSRADISYHPYVHACLDVSRATVYSLPPNFSL